jgi:pimeloyl-ACP methyl ester carboxylesterase
MRVEDGPGRLLLGLGSLLAGLVGIVVGIGVGVRWVAADVITAKTILALGALLAGLILTVLGIRWLTRGLRPTTRFFSASLIALASIVFIWTFSPAVIATNVPPSPESTEPIDLGADGRGVRFTTADGVTLWGWYVPPPEGKVVILRHGAGSTASAVKSQARVLVEHGYGVLLTDARGHSRSEGTAMDFGWHGDADIAAAVDYLVGQTEVDANRIAVLGMSMGGEEAIGAAGSDERIAAVVAEGATARTDQDKTWLADVYGWRGRVQVGLERLQYRLTELVSGSERPISLAEAAAGASPRPILMITGGAMPDEGQAAAHVRETAGDNVSVWTVPGAGHIQGLTVAPEEWEQVVIGFLDQALTPAAP